MIQKVILAQFLDYLKTSNSMYMDSFINKKNLFNRASYIIYLHEYVKQFITDQSKKKNDTDNTYDTVFIPINIDTI